MKQHITVKQLGELSEKGKSRLMKFEVSEDTPREMGTDPTGHMYLGLPSLSIGQMIEFLGRGWYRTIIGFTNVDKINKTATSLEVVTVHPDGLCDTLWLAVKEVLEK